MKLAEEAKDIEQVKAIKEFVKIVTDFQYEKTMSKL